MITVPAARVVRRLRRVPRLGHTLMRAEEAGRDWLLKIDVQRRRRLQREWQACTTADQMLSFSARHLSPGQLPGEVLAFTAFVRSTSPRVFCEIGTLFSGTHFFLTHAVPSITVTIAIDTLPRNKEFLRLLAKPGQRTIFVDGLSQDNGTRQRLADALDGMMIDLLFIDGAHEYENVRSDFLSYRTLVRDGGVIVFHDICEDYGVRYGLQTGRFAGGVPRLWRKLRSCYEYREFVDCAEQDAFGIGAIVYSRAMPLPADL